MKGDRRIRAVSVCMILYALAWTPAWGAQDTKDDQKKALVKTREEKAAVEKQMTTLNDWLRKLEKARQEMHGGARDLESATVRFFGITDWKTLEVEAAAVDKTCRRIEESVAVLKAATQSAEKEALSLGASAGDAGKAAEKYAVMVAALRKDSGATQADVEKGIAKEILQLAGANPGEKEKVVLLKKVFSLSEGAMAAAGETRSLDRLLDGVSRIVEDRIIALGGRKAELAHDMDVFAVGLPSEQVGEGGGK